MISLSYENPLTLNKTQKALLLCQGANLYHVFIKDYRFHKRVGDRTGPDLFGPLHHNLRWNLVAIYVLRRGLGDLPYRNIPDDLG